MKIRNDPQIQGTRREEMLRSPQDGERTVRTPDTNVRTDTRDTWAGTVTGGDVRSNVAPVTPNELPNGRSLDGALGGGAFRTGSPTSWPDVRPAVGKLEGFDRAKLDDPNHQSPKYIVGRILEKYPNTPEGLRQALPEIQRHFPEARIVGSKGDKIDFGNHVDPRSGERLGVVDVIRAAGNGGEAWQWCPEGASGGSAPSAWAMRQGLATGGVDPSMFARTRNEGDDDPWAALRELLFGARSPIGARPR